MAEKEAAKVENKALAEEVVRLQQGDGEAFRKSYEMTSSAAYYTALKIVKNEYDAEDVLQDSYIIVLDRIGEIADPGSFTSWFNKIVANKAKEILRKNNKYLFVDAPGQDGDEDGIDFFDSLEEEREEFNPGAGAEQEELKEMVLDMIDSLSDEKRTVVMLYYYSDLSIKEISESLGVNENTVKSRLFYAKKELAEAVRKFEKKHGRLLGVIPAAVIIWALRSGSATASASFIASGASAAGFAAVSGTAVSSTGAAAAGSAGAVGTAAAGAASAGTAVSGAAASGAAAAGASASVAAGGAAGSALAAGGGLAAKILAVGVAQKIAVGVAAAALIGGTTAGIYKTVGPQSTRAPETSLIEETAAFRAEPVFYANEELKWEENLLKQLKQRLLLLRSRMTPDWKCV